MQSLPEKTADDHATINMLLEAVKGGAEAHRARGTFMSYLASLTANACQGKQGSGHSWFVRLRTHRVCMPSRSNSVSEEVLYT